MFSKLIYRVGLLGAALIFCGCSGGSVDTLPRATGPENPSLQPIQANGAGAPQNLPTAIAK
ncbi:MAG: hypothetical protein ABL921_32395 [Pirellula sp.]